MQVRHYSYLLYLPKQKLMPNLRCISEAFLVGPAVLCLRLIGESRDLALLTGVYWNVVFLEFQSCFSFFILTLHVGESPEPPSAPYSNCCEVSLSPQ